MCKVCKKEHSGVAPTPMRRHFLNERARETLDTLLLPRPARAPCSVGGHRTWWMDSVTSPGKPNGKCAPFCQPRGFTHFSKTRCRRPFSSITPYPGKRNGRLAAAAVVSKLWKTLRVQTHFAHHPVCRKVNRTACHHSCESGPSAKTWVCHALGRYNPVVTLEA